MLQWDAGESAGRVGPRRAAEEGLACHERLQEDYGWGFYLDADGCSLWVSISYAMPGEGESGNAPEWHVGVDRSLAPWPFARWFRRRRGGEETWRAYKVGWRTEPWPI
jgi:hypothetical protein